MGWSSTTPRCAAAPNDDMATGATTAALANPAMASRFQRLDVLGAGTFGVVYRARDRRTGEIVAMKCLRASNLQDRDEFAAFASEVAALETCSGHPSIVHLRASGRLGNNEAFVAMEFVGPTLRHVIKHDRFMRRHTELEARLIMRQLIAGVRRMNRLEIGRAHV